MKTKNSSLAAFSLIEIIGALAVLAILAAVTVPVVIRHVDLAAAQAESANLNAMQTALVQHVLRSNHIPNQVTWGTAISSELGLASTNITVNRRKLNRAFLIDNSGWLGAINLTNTDWYQPAAGTSNSAPSSARLMIVSSIGKALPNAVVSGAPGTASFNDIWNTASGSIPSTWTGWTGKGRDLTIQRINLEPLFHRVLLVTTTGTFVPRCSIGTNAASNVPTGASGTNFYCLDGTVLNLYGTNTTLTLLAREVVRTDLSRVFDSGVWQDVINIGVTNSYGSSSGLSALASSFFTNNAPSGAKWGQTPQAIVGMMSSYMDGYTSWSAMSPCFTYSANGNSYNNGNFSPYNEMQGAMGSGDVIP